MEKGSSGVLGRHPLGPLGSSWRACVRVCVRARVCGVCACVCACVRASVRACHAAVTAIAGADSLLGSGGFSALRALHMHACNMAWCMYIENDVINDAHVLSVHRGDCRGSQLRLPRTADFGGSWEQGVGALAHGMMHGTKRPWP